MKEPLTVIEGADKVLPELERIRRELGGEPVIPAARWHALKAYLSATIEADEAFVDKEFARDPDSVVGAKRAAEVSANRSTLKKMRELENDR